MLLLPSHRLMVRYLGGVVVQVGRDEIGTQV
jgi:hypothetical protein